jgi:hypothetical protein
MHYHPTGCRLDPQPDFTRLVKPSAQPPRRLVPDRLVHEYIVHDDLTVRQCRKLKYLREVSAHVGVGGAATTRAPPNPYPLDHDHPGRMPGLLKADVGLLKLVRALTIVYFYAVVAG